MKIENIDRAEALIKRRVKILDVIDGLETYDVTLNGADGLPFETLDEYVVDKLLALYKQELESVDAEIASL